MKQSSAVKALARIVALLTTKVTLIVLNEVELGGRLSRSVRHYTRANCELSLRQQIYVYVLIKKLALLYRDTFLHVYVF